MSRQVRVNDIIGNSKFNKFFVMIILLGAVMMLFDGYDQGAWGGALTVLEKDTGLGADVFGTISGMGMYGMMIGGICFGMLADRIGRKRTLLICVAIYALFTGLIGFAHTGSQFIAFKFLAGIGLAGVGPVVLALVGEYSPRSSKATMMTVTISSIPVGSALSSVACMVLLNTIGWRPLFYLALIPLLLLPLWIFKMPDSIDFYVHRGETEKIGKTLKRIDPSFEPQGDDEYITDLREGEHISFIESFKGLFSEGRARNTILLWLVFLAAMWTSYSMQIWLARLMVYGGYGINSSLFFLLLFNLCALPAAYIFGRIADKIGFKRAIAIISICVAVLIFCLSFKLPTWLLVILLILDGAGTTGVYNMVYSYITLNYPTRYRGTGIGWACAVGRFGGAWGPMLVGSLVAAQAQMWQIFGLIALPYSLVTFIMLGVKEIQDKQIETM